MYILFIHTVRERHALIKTENYNRKPEWRKIANAPKIYLPNARRTHATGGDSGISARDSRCTETRVDYETRKTRTSDTTYGRPANVLLPVAFMSTLAVQSRWRPRIVRRVLRHRAAHACRPRVERPPRPSTQYRGGAVWRTWGTRHPWQRLVVAVSGWGGGT